MTTSKPRIRVSALVIIMLMVLVVILAYAHVIRDMSTASISTVNNSFHEAEQSKPSFHWKLVTAWPKHFPGLGSTPELFAQWVNAMSDGRLTITVYGAGEVVPALGVFDAVSKGHIEMGHAGAYYWKGKAIAAPFFTTVPFGMTAQEMNAWLHYGGGLALWEELYKPFDLLPLACGNTGVQMAGWFNKEIRTMDDIRGLKMRIPGLAGEIFTRAGGESVTIPGSELFGALKTGVIDATEWVGPYNDLIMGFHEVAKYYYYPGWHEPGSTIELIVNRTAFAALPEDLQMIVKIAARAANQAMLDEYTAKNNRAMQTLIHEHGVQVKRLPDDVLNELRALTEQYLAAYVAGDPFAQKVYDSYQAFYHGVKRYHGYSEKAYIEQR